MSIAIGQPAARETDRLFFTGMALASALALFLRFLPSYFHRSAECLGCTKPRLWKIYHDLGRNDHRRNRQAGRNPGYSPNDRRGAAHRRCKRESDRHRILAPKVITAAIDRPAPSNADLSHKPFTGVNFRSNIQRRGS